MVSSISIKNLGLLLFLLLPLVLSAGTTGKIAGRVVDAKTGESIPGVNVFLENTVMGAATDVDGNYFIIGIPPGEYTLVAGYIGYRDYRINKVGVNVDKTTTINIEMQSTTLELGESIEITAERPLVRKDLTSTESTVDRELIEMLPVENLSGVINLQAGVVEGHFRGGRFDEVLYMVNGVSVNDVYNGSNAIEVENNSIQEVNVISGTFNAEYGQAMSGVVNVVTRDGGEKYEGTLSAYAGNYFTSHDKIFWNPASINPDINVQGTLNGPVPFLGPKVTFFASGRLVNSHGYIYGREVFLPSDHTTDFLLVDNPEDRQFMSHGQLYPYSDSLAQKMIDKAKAISMNSSEHYTADLKVTYKPFSHDKINLEGIYQNQQWNSYEHEFRLNPDGTYNYYQWGITNILSWNHVYSASTFSEVNVSYFHTDFQQYVYKDLFDSRYVLKTRLQDTGANAFYSGGQDMWQFRRNTTTYLLKGDVTSQINLHHQLKMGLEGRQHRLQMHEYEVIPESPVRVAPLTSFQNNIYDHQPTELSFYLQDKMEFEDLVINAGVRYDYFNPDGEIPLDFTRPSQSARRKAYSSEQLSPRLGLAYPISANGVIHASYGHFFQIPSFFYLYTNPEYDIDPLQSSVSSPPQSVRNTIGNAELKPQRTTIYEVGLQQQISMLYGLSLTVYFKDIRNLLGTDIHRTLEGIQYGRYINRDYGYIRGITLEFERRYFEGIAASVDYTFQVAKGNASDPNNAFLDAEGDRETEKQVVPLDWDRRHQINASLNLGRPQNYLFSVVLRYGTGFPYTPASRVVQPLVENGGRKPDIFTIDLYLTKDVFLFRQAITFFLRVYNLLDRLNERDVFSDTGRASYSTEPLYFGGEKPRGINTVDQYYIRPDFYYDPRQIQLGLELKY
jgi:outer membrane receptor protein involved in Fe transport